MGLKVLENKDMYKTMMERTVKYLFKYGNVPVGVKSSGGYACVNDVVNSLTIIIGLMVKLEKENKEASTIKVVFTIKRLELLLIYEYKKFDKTYSSFKSHLDSLYSHQEDLFSEIKSTFDDFGIEYDNELVDGVLSGEDNKYIQL